MFSCLRASGHPRSCFPVITPCSSPSIVLVLRRRPPRSSSERWPGDPFFGLKRCRPNDHDDVTKMIGTLLQQRPIWRPFQLQGTLQLNNKPKINPESTLAYAFMPLQGADRCPFCRLSGDRFSPVFNPGTDHFGATRSDEGRCC